MINRFPFWALNTLKDIVPEFRRINMIYQDDMEIYLQPASKDLKNVSDLHIESFLERTVKIGTAGPATTVINLLKTILGTGMLALPYAFNGLGIIPGAFLLFVCAYFARHGLMVYSRCGMRAGISHDDGIGVLCKLVDRRLGPVVNFALFAMCVGSAISYLCLIGDLLPALLPFEISRNICNSAITVFILFPLSFIRNLNRLQYTSIIGLLGIIYAVILSICILKVRWTELRNIPMIRPEVLKLSSINSIVFVFTCHQSVSLGTEMLTYFYNF
jgi:amino acid permease